VAGWTGCAHSHFFIVCWNRSTFPHVALPRSGQVERERIGASLSPIVVGRREERAEKGVNSLPTAYF
jgi:hypothetical protein